MEATLKFNLDDPSDREAHMRCVKAADVCSVLWDMDSWLRDLIKHPAHDIEDNVHKVYEKVRDKLADTMGSKGVYLDELFT